MLFPIFCAPIARVARRFASLRISPACASICVFAFGFAAPAVAQVSLTALDVPYAQTFDSLPSSGTATWVANATIPGWYAVRTGTGTAIAADTGTGNGGNLYSYGLAASADRALGSIGSSNAAAGNFFWGARLQNNTGGTITSLDVAYAGEQWRNSAAAAQTIAFSYLVGTPAVTGSLTEFQSAGNAVADLDFTSPVTGGTAGALNGNLAANRTLKTFTISGLSLPNGSEIMLRWSDPDHSGSDHGLSIDDVSVTPHGTDGTGGPTLGINDVSLDEGNAGTTTFTFTVSLSAASPTDVTFDIATADGTAIAPSDYTAASLTAQTIPAGSTTYTFTVLVNGDTTAEASETFFVNLANATGATVADAQGLGTIVSDDIGIIRIHDVQGSGATTPIPGATATVEGVVVGNFLGATKLSGFFLQEEDADVDADPDTSEGIFVFCGLCAPNAVAEGQRVRVTGVVSEFQGMTELTPTAASTVVVTDAGNHMADVTPSAISLPIAGDVDAFYEAREAMLVTYTNTLTVSEYFELFRFGQIELVQGDRPRTFTEDNTPDVAGYATHLADLARRQVILDDDNNLQEAPLSQPNGSQSVFYPRANGGFSVGTQGIDFFRGGDHVENLTGVLHWSWAGFGANTWRIRPSAAYPTEFTVANPRPVTPPAVGGAIRAVGMNLLNYFTTIDTTSSSSSGPCGPSGTLDCRGADSIAELDRQRERASVVVCTLNPDVASFMELENTTPAVTINDLLGAVNDRCGGAHPYAFANTGGTLGTDAIRVMQVYRTGIVSPVGSPLVDLDPIHNRPPTAQTYDVVDAANSASGQRFTVVANHFKSKGSCPTSGPDADQNDGQGCWAQTRTQQSTRLLTWINDTVIPAAGDPDVLLLGDFNSYAHETPVTTLEAGGYSDLETLLHGTDAYSYVFSGELGHLDYAFASESLVSQITGADAWHINADETDLLDYNDEIRDAGESTFEEKPDGSALVPPRTVFQPLSPYRASDHDPVVVGLFGTTSSDVSISLADSPDPVTAGTNLTYTVTLTNVGPDASGAVSWTDVLPSGLAFVEMDPVAGWTCTTPAIGAGGTVSCSASSIALGSSVFVLQVAVNPTTAAGTVISDMATVSTAGDPNSANDSASTTTTVTALADLTLDVTDSPDPVVAGSNLTYAVTLTNGGPSAATTAVLTDTLPTGTTFVSLTAPAGWSCSTPAVGAAGAISCANPSVATGDTGFTLVVQVATDVAGATVLSNMISASSGTADPFPGNNATTVTTTVQAVLEGHLTITPTALDFGNQVVGTTSGQMTVTLGNSGNASLDVTARSNASAPFFNAGGTCGNAPFTIAANGSCTVSYAFLPFSVGAATQVINVTSSAPGSGTITLSGNGTAPQVDIAVTIDDGRQFVQVGDLVNYTIRLSNETGPDSATATVHIVGLLPSEMPSLSWTCISSGGATCLSGANDFFSDTVILPPSTHVTYVLSGVLDAEPASGLLEATVDANMVTNVVDPNPANNVATDTPADTVVIFRDGFDDATAPRPLAEYSAAGGFVSAQLSVSASLLDRLGIAPVTVATGELAGTRTAFSIDLARFGEHCVMRVDTRDARGRTRAGAWQTIDLDAAPLDLAWQSASATEDGYLVLTSGAVSLQSTEFTDRGALVRLRVALEGDVPWLTMAPPN
ncbi:MAG: ExeM/NucH family extracellular endonuclease [Dokdonella sp.]|uniref:ExeM/NucH family extracellular endonuclease n=1 Tax=Dokdonella sp. TaxID=2291710 RepID=UPI0032645F23